ncbi:hypothetical protein TRSA_02200 [Treponema saccharophilum]|uniref:Uncharacterized protein n=1 Tax=Treponema saccharophilum DSM 2985 TaxID=907348 RepID=H7ENM9_9SPIR|nr:hypothetical protein TresaDRAFT_0782 [Treponema saccharophilum DSM 2985]BDC95121.1 hypothetical protein TRSA_02200 [Treponema saccharophilum]
MPLGIPRSQERAKLVLADLKKNAVRHSAFPRTSKTRSCRFEKKMPLGIPRSQERAKLVLADLKKMPLGISRSQERAKLVLADLKKMSLGIPRSQERAKLVLADLKKMPLGIFFKSYFRILYFITTNLPSSSVWNPSSSFSLTNPVSLSLFPCSFLMS